MRHLLLFAIVSIFSVACSQEPNHSAVTTESISASADPSSVSLSAELNASLNLSDSDISQIRDLIASLVPRLSLNNLDSILGNSLVNGNLSSSKTLNCDHGGSISLLLQADIKYSSGGNKINASLTSEQSSITFNNCAIGNHEILVLNGTVAVKDVVNSLSLAINLVSKIHSLDIKDSALLTSDLTVTSKGKTYSCPISLSQADSIVGTVNTNNGINVNANLSTQLQGSFCGSSINKSIQLTLN